MVGTVDDRPFEGYNEGSFSFQISPSNETILKTGPNYNFYGDCISPVFKGTLRTEETYPPNMRESPHCKSKKSPSHQKCIR